MCAHLTTDSHINVLPLSRERRSLSFRFTIPLAPLVGTMYEALA
jgi:hypothetical protein